MSSIRAKIFIISLLSLSLVGGFGYLALTSYQQQTKTQSDLAESLKLSKTLSKLRLRPHRAKVSKGLQEIRERMTEEKRQAALSNLIQAYNDSHFRLFKKRKKLSLQMEEQYQVAGQALLKNLHRKIIYYGVLSLITSIVIIFGWFIYIQSQILSPIKNLSRKMMDFLNNRYSYRFTLPSQNEVGHLHATFNSLAQKVLNNIEELKALDRAKSEFLSIASHELRTPLTSIKGSLNLLNSGVAGSLNEMATELIVIAESESDRLIRLINDLLDLAKIEARKFPLNQQWEPLETLISKTIQGIQGLAQKASVDLVYDGKMENVWVHVDGDRIQQVLTNLLSNAIKYSPENGTVTIHADLSPENSILIEVSDEGRGIAPEDQELIFQQFRQATGPKNPLVKGTGLGLAIAKALIDEHGGEMGVHSVPLQGSTFYFTIKQWQLQKPSSTQTQEAA